MQAQADKPRVGGARVLAFANQKGGVTKTSTLINVAAALSELGRRVLVWDVDVNCGSTRILGIPEGIMVYGTHEVMMGDEKAEDVVIRPGDLDTVSLPENVHLIASNVKLEGVERALAERNGVFAASHGALREPVDSLRGKYDYILIDTSPSMNAPTQAAYMATDYFILTAVPEPLAIEGLVNAIRYFNQARKHGNPKLRLMGVVMNQVPGNVTRLSRVLMAEVDEHFGPNSNLGGFSQRFETTISASTVVPSVQRNGQTLFEAEPNHKVTNEYRRLALEMEDRFARLEGGLEAKDTASVAVQDEQVKEATNG